MPVERSSSPPLWTTKSNGISGSNRKICYRCSNLTFKQWMLIFSTVLVPLVIALAAAGLSIQQQYNVNQSNDQKEIQASSMQMDNILADYFERIFTILDANIVRGLSDDQTYSCYRFILTPLTATTLRRMDLARKRLLFLFLMESQLLKRDTPYKYIGLTWISFENVDLSISSDSIIANNWFLDITLQHGLFARASFNNRQIQNVAWDEAILNDATFRRCFLNVVSFKESSLRNTDFTGAELRHIDFRDADLRGSNITPEQLFTSSNELMGVAFPNGSIVPVPNLLSPKHHKIPIPQYYRCQNGQVWNDYTTELGLVMNMFTEDGQDCFFAGGLIFAKSILQQTVDVPRYSTWFSSGRIRYCLRAMIGLKETDNKVGQSVMIVGQAIDENKKILHTAQLGPFAKIITEKQCWPVPIGTTRFIVEFIFQNELAINITNEIYELVKYQTFGLIKDVFLTTEY